MGLASYVDIFNPSRIVIGGGVSESSTHYINQIKEATIKYAMTDCWYGVELLRAQLGNKAGFLGAAHYAFSMSL